ncbi:ornithine cyclodeaminase family protein [Euzebya sp.]|uniref:ornithine cyclodeaminase family protein n=1 Tax=Euzebya sp. TaxID=1971409 RepID=UPI00351847A7
MSGGAAGTNPFAGRRTRVLSTGDVRSLLSVTDTLDVQRQAFTALAKGTVTAAPNSWLRLPDQERRRGWIKVLASHESSSQSLGVKVLARFADNPPGANLGSLVMLFDDEDGFPLAVMDGTVLTGLRTGAGAGLAAEVLSTPDARAVGVVGTGAVARDSLTSVLAVRPSVEAVTVYSRSADRRREFAAWAEASLGVTVRPVDDVAAAVEGAEIVITATNAPEPVLMAEHVVAGQLVAAMGIRTELDPALTAASWTIPDGVDEAVADGKISIAIAAGLMTADDVGPELGAVLLDPPGHDRNRIVVFDSSGVGVQDVTMARVAWERAERDGIGQLIDFGLGETML